MKHPYRNTDLVDPVIMGHEETMYGLFDYLREHDPVSWVEPEGYDPFWSLSKYDDIKFVGSNNDYSKFVISGSDYSQTQMMISEKLKNENWQVREFSPNVPSLEKAFIELTKERRSNE